MSSFLPGVLPGVLPGAPAGRLGRRGSFCGRHPVWVIACWPALLVAALTGRDVVAPTFSDELTLSGSQSEQGADLLVSVIGHRHHAAWRSDALVALSGRCTVRACGPPVKRKGERLGRCRRGGRSRSPRGRRGQLRGRIPGESLQVISFSAMRAAGAEPGSAAQ